MILESADFNFFFRNYTGKALKKCSEKATTLRLMPSLLLLPNMDERSSVMYVYSVYSDWIKKNKKMFAKLKTTGKIPV